MVLDVRVIQKLKKSSSKLKKLRKKRKKRRKGRLPTFNLKKNEKRKKNN
jgi:hypothetical protein